MRVSLFTLIVTVGLLQGCKKEEPKPVASFRVPTADRTEDLSQKLRNNPQLSKEFDAEMAKIEQDAKLLAKRLVKDLKREMRSKLPAMVTKICDDMRRSYPVLGRELVDFSTALIENLHATIDSNGSQTYSPQILAENPAIIALVSRATSLGLRDAVGNAVWSLDNEVAVFMFKTQQKLFGDFISEIDRNLTKIQSDLTKLHPKDAETIASLISAKKNKSSQLANDCFKAAQHM